MAMMANARGVVGVALLLVLASVTACSLTKRDELAPSEELPYRLSDEQCDNLIEIRTEGISVTDIAGPSKAQQAMDAANPAGADLSQYVLTLTIEQSFENLLDRSLIIEEASATIEDGETGSSYETDYDLDAPIELAAQVLVMLTFQVTMPADRMSPSVVLGLVEGSALGMTIAPALLVTVPDSDNCGYSEGMRVQGKQGTVEVQRPVEPSLLGDLFNGVLKGVLHG